ncbi:MAG: beta-lactamase family protein [Chloroflexi bacterium]|nr:beta-lactamase family protein [Chloroflexota bacterium]
MIRKYGKPIILILILGYGLFLAWWLWAAGPETVWRIISYESSGIEDYKLFPSRTLAPSNSPFQFEDGTGNGRVPTTIALHNNQQSLETFLRDTDTVAFLVIKDDVILMEQYFQGYGEATPTLAFSMSKSFSSMLVGAAIADGFIQSVDQPVTAYVPELAGAGYDKVTIRHLLQMTSGMDYVEVEGRDTSLHNRFYYTTRLEHELLQLDLATEPGQEFSYKSGENGLLGLILSRAIAPQTITEYTQTRLWQPLGMEYNGAWNLDSENGLEKTWCCLSATARDYAKLGRLMLHNGNWQGDKILPADWVAQSTKTDTVNGSIWNYQYQWWLVTEGGGDFTALGHLGQFVYVNPAQDVIIVRLGNSRGGLEWDEWKTILAFIAEGVE